MGKRIQMQVGSVAWKYVFQPFGLTSLSTISRYAHFLYLNGLSIYYKSIFYIYCYETNCPNCLPVYGTCITA